MDLKKDLLLEILRGIDRPIVALSGGVDSGLLFALCVEARGEATLGVSAETPSLSAEERDQIRATVREAGGRHVWVATNETADPRYRRNGADRCYWCKEALFAAMEEVRAREGGGTLLYGETGEDASDIRPGSTSARTRGVRAPLAEAGLTKKEIRLLAANRGLSVSDRPSSPCLSSRIASGIYVTPEVLARIEAGERILRDAGLSVLRLRQTQGGSRVETDPASTRNLLGSPRWTRLAEDLARAGFSGVRLDPRGYRRGSLHDEIS